MIFVFLVIAIILLIIANIDGDFDFIAWTTVVLICTIAAMCFLICSVRSLNVIDDKIAMYESQNTKIEEQISDVVERYMEYESGVFTEVSSDSAITLVALYPDLKSDALVESQIELYTDNNRKITELMEKKINGSVTRWWLYFGGE